MNPEKTPSSPKSSAATPLAHSPIAKHSVQPNAFGPGLPCVSSNDLIGKDREIMIEHGGIYYRLRITRANKLILTK